MTQKTTFKQNFLMIQRKEREVELDGIQKAIELNLARLAEYEQPLGEAIKRHRAYLEEHPDSNTHNDKMVGDLGANVNRFESAKSGVLYEIDKLEMRQRNLLALINSKENMEGHAKEYGTLRENKNILLAEIEANKNKVAGLLSQQTTIAESIEREEAAGAEALSSGGNPSNQGELQRLLSEQRMVSTAIDQAMAERGRIDGLIESNDRALAESERMFKLAALYQAKDEMDGASLEFAIAASRVSALSGKREFAVRISDEQARDAGAFIMARLVGQAE